MGIVGLGKMGILHSGIVNSLPDVRVKAICEKEGFLRRVAKAFLPKTVSFYKDYLEMVKNEDLAAVLVTTPIDTHVPIVVDLVEADRGLSVFVEKPLAVSEQQAKLACEAASQMQGVHMVGFQKRFSPVFQRAKKFIDDGILGELMFFRAYTFSSDVLREGTSWRFRRGSGGVLLDLAPHLIDILLWFFGEPADVSGIKRRIYSKEVDDYVHADLSYSSGLKGHIDACWSIRNFRVPEISIELHGRNGVLTATDDHVRIAVEMERGNELKGSQVFNKQSFDTSVPFLLAEPEFTKEDEAFLSSLERRSLPDSNFFVGAKVNAIIDRITANLR